MIQTKNYEELGIYISPSGMMHFIWFMSRLNYVSHALTTSVMP